jgi:hypothetical protein
MPKAARRERRPAHAVLLAIGVVLGLLGASAFLALARPWKGAPSHQEACRGLSDEAQLTVATEGR